MFQNLFNKMKHHEIIEILSSSSDDENEGKHLSALEMRKRALNISFTNKDLKTLDFGNWLNDSIINSYINLMRPEIDQSRFGITNSFFFTKLQRDGCEEASNWEGIKGRQLNDFELFLIPICAESHWFLFVLDFNQSTLHVLDSLGIMHLREARIVNSFLGFQGIDELQIERYEVPKQLNGYDCGAFLLQNIRCVFFGDGSFEYSQSDIAYIRQRIKNELINCELE